MRSDSEYKNIVGILKGIRRKIALLEAIRGSLRVIGLTTVMLAVLVGLTSIVWPSSPVRTTLDVLLLLVFLLAIYFAIGRPLLRQSGLLPIARKLEKRYGAFQTRLIAALELYDLAGKNRENYSLDLIEKTINDAGGFIADIDTDVIVDKKPLISTSVKIAVLAAAVVVGITLRPSAVEHTWVLYSNPLLDIDKPPEFALELTPDQGEFFRNRDLTVSVRPVGKTPREVELYFRFEEGDWTWEPMDKGESPDAPLFGYTFKKIQRSVDIYARSGAVKTQVAHLDIVDPPRLVNINLRTSYPSYTGLPDSKGEPNDGNVAALKGSVIYMTATANKPLSSGFQLFSDSSKIPVRIDGDRVSGSFSVKDDGRYTIMIADKANRANPEPIWYDIQALEDYPPSIQLVFPGVDVDLNERMILPLDIAVSDDYGFGKLNLVWWILSEGRQSEQSKENIKIVDNKNLDQRVSYVWDINKISPLPGDLIYYYCEVSDNDIISGPKWARSRTFVARLPSLDEILAEVDDSQENQINELEEVIKQHEDLQKQINDLSREMMKASDVNWQKQQAAKNILEKQKDLAEKMQNLAEEMQENMDRLQENRLISEEIAEKMQEMQNLLEEVATPEMKEAMKKLQEALKNLDPDELRKALMEMEMTSKELLENLDRSLSLLKKLAIEQKLDMLTQLADKIVKDQEEINNNIESAGGDSSQLASQNGNCQKNSSQFQSLKNQFGQLQEMDSEMNMIPDLEESEAGEEINNSEIPSDFESMSKSMCQGSSGMCKKSGKRLMENLLKVADALKKAQGAMQMQMKADIAAKLQKVAEDLLYLSGRQEAVIDSTTAYAEVEEYLREFAGEQSQIEAAAERVAETVSAISKETLFVNFGLLRLMGTILGNLSDASKYLGDRSGAPAITSETMAMSNMNTAVLMLLKARENSANSCSGSGMSEMMKKLSELSSGQQSLNQSTQSQLPIPGMKLSMSQQSALKQLAAQQEALRQQLQELTDQFGERGNMLGRLDALSEEMKKVVDDLARSRVNRQTLERQERILSRLLDAQKSVNRREFSQKRKAEQGEDIIRKSPVISDEMRDKQGWLSGVVENALKENYPRKYEQLIKAYFRSLQNEGASVEQ